MRSSDHPNPDARFWIERANAVRLKLNLGWWTACSGQMFVLGGIVLFAALFYLRSVGWQLLAWQGLAVVMGGIVTVSAIGWATARRHFCTNEQAMVRLEAKLHLHNALSTAAAGVGPWPVARRRNAGDDDPEDGGVKWRIAGVAGPLVAYFILCAGGLFVPVFADGQKRAISEPMGWQQMESTLEALEQEKIVEPESLEKLREQIRELRSQPEDEWYSHSSMEATDHLKRNLDAAVQDMADELADAERSLDAMSGNLEELSDSARERALADYDAAVKGLDRNGLELNKELMEKLQGLDPSQLNQLDKEQIEELRERLRSASKTSDGLANGQGSDGGMSSDEKALQELLNGKNGQGEGESGQPGIGDGGTTRGPGTAPVNLSKDEKDLRSKNLEGVTNEDLSRAQPGDLLGIGDGQHDIDEIRVEPTAAGDVHSDGMGGTAVWRESLLPDEKKVLKKYFK